MNNQHDKRGGGRNKTMGLIYLIIVVILILIVIFVAFRLVGAQTEETQIDPEQQTNSLDQLWQFLLNGTKAFNSENITTHQTDALNLTIPQIQIKVP